MMQPPPGAPRENSPRKKKGQLLSRTLDSSVASSDPLECPMGMIGCLPDPVCVIDQEGRILRSNVCFQSEVVRTSVNFLVDIVGKAGKQEVVDALAVCAGGTGARLYAISTFTFAGETQLPVLRSMNWSIGLLDTDDSSSPVEYVLCGHFRDALENQTVAEVNTLDNQRFSVTTDEFLDFFQKAPIALHWLSGTGHVLWANDTQLKNLGYCAKEYIGHPITEFLCPGEEVKLGVVFNDLSAGRTVRNAPIRFLTKAGEVKYLVVDSNANFNEDGSFRHTRCFIRNDNERIVREAVLETDRRVTAAATAAKDKFIRRVFHEVQTPLHVLSGMLGGGTGEGPSLSLTEQDLYEVNRTLDVVLGIVTDLNFATSCSAGDTPCLEKKATNLRILVSDVVAAVATVEGAHARLYVDVADNLPEGVLVETSLDRVLFNLLTNAVRFSPPASEVRLIVTNTTRRTHTIDSDGGSRKEGDAGDTGENMDTGERREGDGGGRGEGETRIPHLSLNNNNPHKVGRFQGPEGVTFSISNSTTQAVDVAEIDRFFRAYYHCVPSPKAGDISGESRGMDLSSATGIGLGLYVSFQLVQLMGGMLSVILPPALAPVRDITFSFTLPLTNCPPPASPRAGAHCGFRKTDSTGGGTGGVEPGGGGEGGGYTSSFSNSDVAMQHIQLDSLSGEAVPSDAVDPACVPQKPRILVVDDSPICQKMVNKALGSRFCMDFASNGLEAVEKLTYKPCLFNAVLMDLRMPIMDGIEATAHIRDKLDLKTLPIIALTAEHGDLIRQEVFAAGATDLMNKPAKTTELVTMLHKHLREGNRVTG